MNNPTLTYYNENVDAFLSSTTTVDLSEIQDQFLSYLNPDVGQNCESVE